MTRYPTQLHYDGSGSAFIRLFGCRSAEILLHWKQNVKQNFLACPDDVSLLWDNSNPNTPKKQQCSGCRNDVQSIKRTVAMGWDITKKRWCMLIAPEDVVIGAFKASTIEVLGHSIDLNSINRGEGPDLALQIESKSTLVTAIQHTLGEPRGDGKPPTLEDFLRGMESRSVWKIFDV